MISTTPEDVIVSTDSQNNIENIFTPGGVNINPEIDRYIDINLAAQNLRVTTIVFSITEVGYMNTLTAPLNLYFVFYYNGIEVVSISSSL